MLASSALFCTLCLHIQTSEMLGSSSCNPHSSHCSSHCRTDDTGSTFRVKIPLGCAHLPPSQVKTTKHSINRQVLDISSAMPSSPPSLLPDVSNLPDGRSNKYTQSSSWWLPSLEIATVPTHENASITPVTSQQTTSTSTQPAVLLSHSFQLG